MYVVQKRQVKVDSRIPYRNHMVDLPDNLVDNRLSHPQLSCSTMAICTSSLFSTCGEDIDSLVLFSNI